MKNSITKLILTALICVLPSLVLADTHVKGYTKKDGTYVAPHVRSSPDKSKDNNYGTKGNVNPYTGKPGTKDPFKK